jgi:hypothetical protein
MDENEFPPLHKKQAKKLVTKELKWIKKNICFYIKNCFFIEK